MADWIKILITAVVSSVSTAAVAEPLKGWLADLNNRRRLRKTLYRELAITYLDIRASIAELRKANDKRLVVAREVKTDYFDAAQNDPIFLELNEAVALHSLYFTMNTVIGRVPDADGKEQLLILEEVQELIETSVAEKPFSTRRFNKAKQYAQRQVGLTKPLLIVKYR